MKLVLIIEQKYIYETKLAQRLGFSPEQDRYVLSGITENGICEHVTTPDDLRTAILLLSNTTIKTERLLSLFKATPEPLVFVLHLREGKKLRNIYSRIAAQSPQQKILYCYQHSDAKYLMILLEKLVSCPGSRAHFLQSNFAQLEAEALRALRMDFLQHDEYLYAYARFLDPNLVDKQIPYLWQRFFMRFPNLSDIVRRHYESKGNKSAQIKINTEIENYLEP